MTHASDVPPTDRRRFPVRLGGILRRLPSSGYQFDATRTLVTVIPMGRECRCEGVDRALRAQGSRHKRDGCQRPHAPADRGSGRSRRHLPFADRGGRQSFAVRFGGQRCPVRCNREGKRRSGGRAAGLSPLSVGITRRFGCRRRAFVDRGCRAVWRNSRRCRQ